MYLDYLKEVREFQKTRERELDAWMQAETQRVSCKVDRSFKSSCTDKLSNIANASHPLPQVWQKQLEKWNREKQAREQLMAEVLHIRKEQVHAKSKELFGWICPSCFDADFVFCNQFLPTRPSVLLL